MHPVIFTRYMVGVRGGEAAPEILLCGPGAAKPPHLAHTEASLGGRMSTKLPLSMPTA